jgi:hypothetical protein
MILTQGLYVGQASWLDLEASIAFSSIFNFFSDYELPFKDGIVKKEMFLRAAQDGYLPNQYNAFVVNRLFEDGVEMDFYVLAISIKALRMFVHNYGVEGNVMTDGFGQGN